MYVDSNVLILASLDGGRLGTDAGEFLRRVKEGRVNAALSPLVLDEVMWALQKTLGRENADRTVTGIMALPFSWLDIGYGSIRHARRHFRNGLDPRDAFHAGVMNDYSINEIVSEDAHFDMIKEIRRISIKDALKGR